MIHYLGMGKGDVPRVGRPRNSNVNAESPREEIVAAAARLFAADGYAQTSVSAIARAAGLRQSSLYYWFPNKEAIVEELIDKNRESLEIAREMVDRPEPASARLYRIIFIDVVQMCSAPLDFYDLESVALAQPAEFGKYFFADYRELGELMSTVIRQGQSAGEFRSAEPDSATAAALAMNEGLQYRYRRDGSGPARMGELAHLSAQTSLGALLRDRRRLTAARATAETLGSSPSPRVTTTGGGGSAHRRPEPHRR
ncbi:MAG: TetR/AcrR family transcriptional regulator [Actinomycetota bacterium]|nr:TetR/AcrR family transcriptional regulator [Actinomycetota bacterium]